jgi:hypothetical protein
LCRPTIWPFALLVPIVVRPQSPTAPKPHWALLAGLLISILPWAIRNAIVFGEPCATTTHGGYTLLLANNPVFYNEVARQPWGTVWSHDSLEAWQRAMLAEAEKELGPSPGEIALDRWQAAQARRNIQQDPSGFTMAVLYRVRSLWSLSPRNKTLGWAAWLVAVWYGALFIAAAVGLWREARRDLRWAVIALLLIVSIQAVHLVYWTDTRMRAPLHPVFALLAAVALSKEPRTEEPRTE